MLYAHWALAHLRGPAAVGISGACLRAVLIAVSFTLACAMALWRGVCMTALHHPPTVLPSAAAVGGRGSLAGLRAAADSSGSDEGCAVPLALRACLEA